MNPCIVPECGRQRVGMGLCNKHYSRQRASGSFTETQRMAARNQRTAADGTYKCMTCGRRYPRTLEFFGVDRRKADGMRAMCKSCACKAVKASTIKARYGLSVEEFASLLNKQSSCCAICFREFQDGSSKVLRAHVDHDHKTGRVRGLLCHHCNVLIGHAQDSVAALESAIRYLNTREDARAEAAK